MKHKKILWDREEFEDTVAAGIIGLYETRLPKNIFKDPLFRVRKQDLWQIKSFGLYFPPEDRMAFPDEIDIEPVNAGCFSFKQKRPEIHENDAGESDPDRLLRGYLSHVYFRKSKHNRLNSELKHPGVIGTLYELFRFDMFSKDGLIVSKRYVWAGKDGKVHPLYHRRPHNYPYPDRLQKELEESAQLMSVTHGFWEDRKVLWNVRAEEKEVRATFGVYEEQIKSLFYARNIPLSSTGRKRPILHWVSSHRRRTKAGVDVDIEKYLRGITEFEMSGTKFRITRPLKSQN